MNGPWLELFACCNCSGSHSQVPSKLNHYRCASRNGGCSHGAHRHSHPGYPVDHPHDVRRTYHCASSAHASRLYSSLHGASGEACTYPYGRLLMRGSGHWYSTCTGHLTSWSANVSRACCHCLPKAPGFCTEPCGAYLTGLVALSQLVLPGDLEGCCDCHMQGSLQGDLAAAPAAPPGTCRPPSK